MHRRLDSIDNSDKVFMFIPNNMGRTNTSKFGTKFVMLTSLQLIAVIAEIAAVILFCINYLLSNTMMLVMSAGIFIILFVNQWLWRKVILKERQLRKRYQEYQERELTKADAFYDILYVEDNGKITFHSGEEACIVKMEKEYIFGREKGFKLKHYEGLTQFYTDMLNAGYNLAYYSLTIGDTNVKPLEATTQNLLSYPRKSKIVILVSMIISYVKGLVGTLATEMEYIIVYTNGTSLQSDSLIRDVSAGIDYLKDSLYENARIIGTKGNTLEVNILLRDYLGLETMDTQSLSAKFYDKSMADSIKIINEDTNNEVFMDEGLLEDEVDTEAASDLLSQFKDIKKR